jgi:drug/metabolite transporter (DMT)-like permease
MGSYYFPMALVVTGMVFYHLAQKSIPKGVNPFFAICLAYLVGIVMCGIGGFLLPSNRSFLASVRESSWAIPLLGAAAACIEVGFVLVYRMGWKIGVATVTANASATLVLIPIGFFVFKDHLSTRNVLGLAFCLVGLALLVRE